MVGEWIPQQGATNIYHFNGDSTDYSGNGNNGTDTAMTYVPGKFGKCGSFNGSTSQVSFPNTPSTGATPFTLAAWVKTTSSGGHFGILNYGSNPSNQNLNLYMNSSNQLQFDLSGPVTGPNSVKTINDGKWHFITATNISNTVQLYIDGDPNGASVGMTINIVAGANHSIGVDQSAFWNGFIDEVMMIPVGFTPKQIKNYYAWATGRRLGNA